MTDQNETSGQALCFWIHLIIVYRAKVYGICLPQMTCVVFFLGNRFASKKEKFKVSRHLFCVSSAAAQDQVGLNSHRPSTGMGVCSLGWVDSQKAGENIRWRGLLFQKIHKWKLQGASLAAFMLLRRMSELWSFDLGRLRLQGRGAHYLPMLPQRSERETDSRERTY